MVVLQNGSAAKCRVTKWSCNEVVVLLSSRATKRSRYELVVLRIGMCYQVVYATERYVLLSGMC